MCFPGFTQYHGVWSLQWVFSEIWRPIFNGISRDNYGRSVSLCSLRSLRASMCQLFKIHKARGECQERTKLNDLRRSSVHLNSPRRSLRSREIFASDFWLRKVSSKSQRCSLRFCFSVNLEAYKSDRWFILPLSGFSLKLF